MRLQRNQTLNMERTIFLLACCGLLMAFVPHQLHMAVSMSLIELATALATPMTELTVAMLSASAALVGRLFTVFSVCAAHHAIALFAQAPTWLALPTACRSHMVRAFRDKVSPLTRTVTALVAALVAGLLTLKQTLLPVTVFIARAVLRLLCILWICAFLCCPPLTGVTLAATCDAGVDQLVPSAEAGTTAHSTDDVLLSETSPTSSAEHARLLSTRVLLQAAACMQTLVFAAEQLNVQTLARAAGQLDVQSLLHTAGQLDARSLLRGAMQEILSLLHSAVQYVTGPFCGPTHPDVHGLLGIAAHLDVPCPPLTNMPGSRRFRARGNRSKSRRSKPVRLRLLRRVSRFLQRVYRWNRRALNSMGKYVSWRVQSDLLKLRWNYLFIKIFLREFIKYLVDGMVRIGMVHTCYACYSCNAYVWVPVLTCESEPADAGQNVPDDHGTSCLGSISGQESQCAAGDVAPAEPVAPIEPIAVEPGSPTGDMAPAEPVAPIEPAEDTKPTRPTRATGSTASSAVRVLITMLALTVSNFCYLLAPGVYSFVSLVVISLVVLAIPLVAANSSDSADGVKHSRIPNSVRTACRWIVLMPVLLLMGTLGTTGPAAPVAPATPAAPAAQPADCGAEADVPQTEATSGAADDAQENGSKSLMDIYFEAMTQALKTPANYIVKRVVLAQLILEGKTDLEIKELLGSRYCLKTIKELRKEVEQTKCADDLLDFFTRKEGTGKAKCELFREKLPEILDKVDKGDYLTLRQIQNMIYEDYQKKKNPEARLIALSTIRRALIEAGFRRLKCFSRPYGASSDLSTQYYVHHMLPLFKKAVDKQAVVLFMDAVHNVFGNELVGHKWALVRKECRTHSGRQRRSTLGAINLVTGKMTFISTNGSVTHETVMELYKMIHRQYGDQEIYIFLDNCKVQYNSESVELAKKLGIHLEFIPPLQP